LFKSNLARKEIVDTIAERIIGGFDPRMIVIFGFVTNNTAEDNCGL